MYLLWRPRREFYGREIGRTLLVLVPDVDEMQRMQIDGRDPQLPRPSLERMRCGEKHSSLQTLSGAHGRLKTIVARLSRSYTDKRRAVSALSGFALVTETRLRYVTRGPRRGNYIRLERTHHGQRATRRL